MENKERENKVLKIMTNMVNKLREEGPSSLNSMSEAYQKSNEMGLCLMAFSRLEAEGIIVQKSDGRWKVSERKM